MGLDDEILHLLGDSPQKAAEIARLLKRTREAVNSALYGSLKGSVIQDKTYRWSLMPANGGGSKTHSDAEPNKRASLFRYYIDCLAVDAGVEVSVFASGKQDSDSVLFCFRLGEPVLSASSKKIAGTAELRLCADTLPTRVRRSTTLG